MPYNLPAVSPPLTDVPGAIAPPQTISQFLDNASPESLADIFRLVQLGRVFRRFDVTLQSAVPIVDASQLSTLQSFGIDYDAPAASVQRAYSRVGTPGELTAATPNTTPSTGQIAVAPNGGIVVLASDAQTNVDVDFRPAIGYSVLFTAVPVLSSVWAVPAFLTAQGVVYLQYANADTGTTTGQNVIVAPGSASGTAKQANLNAAKTQVQFHTADAVLTADIRIFVRPGTYLDGYGNVQQQNLDTILQQINNSFT